MKDASRLQVGGYTDDLILVQVFAYLTNSGRRRFQPHLERRLGTLGLLRALSSDTTIY